MSSAPTSALARGSPRETASNFRAQGEDARTSGSRSAGKGCRRRAAAEQRRIEQQRWGEYLEDDDDILSTPSPSPPNRRRSRRSLRRSTRRNTAQEEMDDYLAGYSSSVCRRPTNDALDLDMALAISLSLAESAPGHGGSSLLPEISIASSLDMSYENLVNLENVRIVAPTETVNKMTVIPFKCHNDSESSDELCPICQSEFVEGDSLMLLPCEHTMHKECGEEWLLSYSKACPICKCDVCE